MGRKCGKDMFFDIWFVSDTNRGLVNVFTDTKATVEQAHKELCTTITAGLESTFFGISVCFTSYFLSCWSECDETWYERTYTTTDHSHMEIDVESESVS